MDMLSLMVRNAGRQELSRRRLERMLIGACLRIPELGLKDGEVRVEFSDKPILNGQRIPLKIEVKLPSGNGAPEERVSHQLARTLGETAKQLYPENGWPPRRVEIIVEGTSISWSG